MPNQRQLPRNRLKTRTGCLRCKQRRIKCDETHPHCNQCTRRAHECPGYKRPLKWTAKHEVEHQTYQGNFEHAPAVSTVEVSEPTIAQFLVAPSEPESAICNTRDARALYMASQAANFQAFADPGASHTHDGGKPRYQSCSDDGNASTGSLDLLSSNEALGPGLECTAGELMDWSDLYLPLTLSLEDKDTEITRHYFSSVCRIQSCVDSSSNFFRGEIGTMMASSPLIYHCVLSMSAAHLANIRGDLGTTALDHRTKAITCLKLRVMNMKNERDLQSCPTVDYSTETLLGSILLGMTDGWHNPSFLGSTHLHGARVLFKRWISGIDKGTGTSLAFACSSRVGSAMVGIMAYWEAMSSFLTTQSLDAMSYLENVCDQGPTTIIHPTPWTGIGTALFVYLAKVGTLARQRALVKNLSLVGKSEEIQNQLKTDLVESARDTEAALLAFRAPSKDRVEDTGDPSTPLKHLQQLVQVYRLSALLELYRNFPALLNGQVGALSEEPAPAHKILALTTAILTTIATIPQTSGVNSLLTLPLIIAGSTLQSTIKSTPRQFREGSWAILSDDIVSLSSQDDVQLYWRNFVRSRLQAIRDYVGIATVSRAIEIVEKVWTRCDMQALSLPMEFIQWIDVMVDEKLEAIFG